MTSKEDMGGKSKASDSGSHVPGTCPQVGRSVPLLPGQVPFTLLPGVQSVALFTLKSVPIQIRPWCWLHNSMHLLKIIK